MTGRHDIRAELEPGIDPPEAHALARLADRLALERPVPSPGFRSRLRAGLLEAGRPAPRPAHLRRLVAAYAISGLILLGMAALGLADAGPLAPGQP